jgi:hypothetical protein
MRAAANTRVGSSGVSWYLRHGAIDARGFSAPSKPRRHGRLPRAATRLGLVLRQSGIWSEVATVRARSCDWVSAMC